nr:MAG TPA: hypothetical protein [Caudoviricetes sp.]
MTFNRLQKKKHDRRICRQRFLVSVYICSVGLSST